MFNNSVKHKSEMVGDHGAADRRGGNGIILTARI